MRWLTTTKLISKQLKPTDYRQYWAEFFLLLLLGVVYMGIGDLAELRSGAPVASAQRNAFALMGALGLYGIRLSSFVAMFRRYRMPQIAEWCIFIIATAAMAILFVFSGMLVKAYAGAHDYQFCYQQHARAATYIFARTRLACPALPSDASGR